MFRKNEEIQNIYMVSVPISGGQVCGSRRYSTSHYPGYSKIHEPLQAHVSPPTPPPPKKKKKEKNLSTTSWAGGPVHPRTPNSQKKRRCCSGNSRQCCDRHVGDEAAPPEARRRSRRHLKTGNEATDAPKAGKRAERW